MPPEDFCQVENSLFIKTISSHFQGAIKNKFTSLNPRPSKVIKL
ncbi:hypothetical protein N44_04568 [Microcystis aeruginosa NIES-44]|uniref:Uncharacterized protein n=1 Tax=Microcystis aeruginosa NIES-44 TaxID=449439 RepID=A0A0A1W0V5_MICAE|nr:hypothetical protein N44_04568 [Microcystis aeruginosa NIES-44]